MQLREQLDFNISKLTLGQFLSNLFPWQRNLGLIQVCFLFWLYFFLFKYNFIEFCLVQVAVLVYLSPACK